MWLRIVVPRKICINSYCSCVTLSFLSVFKLFFSVLLVAAQCWDLIQFLCLIFQTNFISAAFAIFSNSHLLVVVFPNWNLIKFKMQYNKHEPVMNFQCTFVVWSEWFNFIRADNCIKITRKQMEYLHCDHGYYTMFLQNFIHKEIISKPLCTRIVVATHKLEVISII